MARRKIEALWKTVGGIPRVMTPEKHDQAVAMTSHLPHFIAHALTQTVLRRRDRQGLKGLMAGSFRDTTRVASSDPDQWVQIFQSNLPALRKAVRAFEIETARLRRHLSHRSLRAQLRASTAFRKPLFAQSR